MSRPVVLAIGGLDPCAGAGILADVKTLEQCGVLGMGVVSAVTHQHECAVHAVDWISSDAIVRQIEVLAEKHCPRSIKIGLIENARTLSVVLACVERWFPEAEVVWDPIIRASAGYEFHASSELEAFRGIIPKVSVLTPNRDEFAALFPAVSLEHADADSLKAEALVVKGGHADGILCDDIILERGGERSQLNSARLSGAHKHGSGCMYAAALAAGLAHGLALKQAAQYAKGYVRTALSSNATLLAYHSARNVPPSVCLQFVSDGKNAADQLAGIRIACESGIRWVQLRAKQLSGAQLLSLAVEAKRLCDASRAILIINDNAEVAAEVGAHGAHLGPEDMPPSRARELLGPQSLIGASANTVRDLQRLAHEDLDYVGLGPLRTTATKSNLRPILGFHGMRQLVSSWPKSRIPLIAIGGIVASDVTELVSLGISGVAVSGSICRAVDPAASARQFLEALCEENVYGNAAHWR